MLRSRGTANRTSRPLLSFRICLATARSYVYLPSHYGIQLTVPQINGVKIGKGQSRIIRDGNEVAFGTPTPQTQNGGQEDYRESESESLDRYLS